MSETDPQIFDALSDFTDINDWQIFALFCESEIQKLIIFSNYSQYWPQEGSDFPGKWSSGQRKWFWNDVEVNLRFPVRHRLFHSFTILGFSCFEESDNKLKGVLCLTAYLVRGEVIIEVLRCKSTSLSREPVVLSWVMTACKYNEPFLSVCAGSRTDSDLQIANTSQHKNVLKFIFTVSDP